MFALVQFLVDKVLKIVPVEDIKDFNADSPCLDCSQAYEVFWNSPNGEGTGYWYAVVLLVEATKELIEQRKKRVKIPPAKRLEELLALTLKDETKKSLDDQEIRRKNKEIQEKRSICEKEKLKDILKRKLKEERTRSMSPDEDKRLVSNSKKIKKRHVSSESSAEDDDLVLKSELKTVKEKYNNVLHKLKLKEEENTFLKKKNDKLQELNMRLQTQLLTLLSANGSLGQDLPTTENILPKKMVKSNEGGSLERNPPITKKLSEPVNTFINILPKEMVKCNEGGSLGQNPPTTDKFPESVNTSINSLPKETVKCNEGGSISEQTPSPQEKFDTVFVTELNCDQERLEVIKSERNSVTSLQRREPLTNGLYLHDDGNLLKWEDDQIQLAPGVCLQKDQWEKVLSSKSMNASKLVRNLAVSLWGSENLKERSVTGIACRRFKKDGIEAKKALTPVKVDAVQNGLRFWLTEYQKKEEQEVLKLSPVTVVRKMLSDKIMDVSKQPKINK